MPINGLNRDESLRNEFSQEVTTRRLKQMKYLTYKQLKPFIGTTLSKAYVMSKVHPLTDEDILLLEAEDIGSKNSNDENKDNTISTEKTD